MRVSRSQYRFPLDRAKKFVPPHTAASCRNNIMTPLEAVIKHACSKSTLTSAFLSYCWSQDSCCSNQWNLIPTECTKHSRWPSWCITACYTLHFAFTLKMRAWNLHTDTHRKFSCSWFIWTSVWMTSRKSEGMKANCANCCLFTHSAATELLFWCDKHNRCSFLSR